MVAVVLGIYHEQPQILIVGVERPLGGMAEEFPAEDKLPVFCFEARPIIMKEP